MAALRHSYKISGFWNALASAKQFGEKHSYGCGKVNLWGIASDLGVSNIEPSMLNVDGYVGRHKNGELIIRYREDATPERKRFTIAHELGHILLAKSQGKYLDRPVARNFERDQHEEAAVNRIAAELLMPEQRVLESLKSQPVKWTIFDKSRTQFQVSTTAFIRRLFEIKALLAISLKINLHKSELYELESVKCHATESANFRLFIKPQKLAQSILFESARQTQHSITVEVNQRKYILPCHGKLYESSFGPVYQVIGWRQIGNLFPRE